MKKINILFLLLLPAAVYCSNDSTKTKKIQVGVSFSPDYCFRSLRPDADSKWIADSRDTIETAKFGYTAGANFEFKINKKLDVATGILFSDSGERTNKYSLESASSAQEPVMYSYNFHYYYLSIPLKANYYFLTGKVGFYLTAGVSANFFLGQKTTAITGFGNSVSRTDAKTDAGFSKVNLGMIAGCGVKYAISKNTELRAEPVYRRSLTSIIDAPVKTYLYSVGLNVGIYFNL
jgi:opacity protein-like surface antigen